MADTPNMNMSLPVVGGTLGPAWASELNTALEVVDAHDHVSGNGVQIPVAGLNINGDLSFNSHNIIDLNSLVLDSLSADPSSATTVYVKNGELFYIDDSAQAVQITDNGSIAGASGSIGGLASPASATYSAFNKDFTFNYDSASPAKLNIGDVHLFPFDGSTVYSNYVNLKSNTALGVQYDWTFPLAHPSKTSPLIWSGAGQVDDIELNDGQFLIGSTAGAVAAGTIAATANQTTVTASANGIAVGTVQDIGTGSSPTFTGVLVDSGSLGTPSLRFSTDTDLGLWRAAANVLGFAANQVRASTSGTISVPFYSFDSDPDTGMYRNGTNNIALVTAGAAALDINATQDVNITNALTVGDTLEVGGGGAFKVTTYTGTLTAGNLTITVPGQVLGLFGFFNRSGTSSPGSWAPIGDSPASSWEIYFQSNASAGGVDIEIERTDSTDRQYRIVVFHT